ncbi:hypothetical protein QQF64_006525 [Cirrhinus molitorella]|uniref:Uncharacterized protein n=1 Tax=Cirrhinus molitorella TaxID=172907 RepID=A0ABR3M813_9TELE
MLWGQTVLAYQNAPQIPVSHRSTPACEGFSNVSAQQWLLRADRWGLIPSFCSKRPQRDDGTRFGEMSLQLRLHLPSLSLPISSSSIDGCQRCAEPALPSPANRAKVSAPRIIIADRPPSPPAADG